MWKRFANETELPVAFHALKKKNEKNSYLEALFGGRLHFLSIQPFESDMTPPLRSSGHLREKDMQKKTMNFPRFVSWNNVL